MVNGNRVFLFEDGSDAAELLPPLLDENFLKEYYDQDDKVFDKLCEMAEIEILEEGANAEYTRIFSKYFKAIRANSMKAKDSFKSSKFKEAKEYYTKAVLECKELEREFSRVDDTILSTVLSYVIWYFVTTVPLVIAAIIIAIPASLIAAPFVGSGFVVASGSSAVVVVDAGETIATYIGTAIGISVKSVGIIQNIIELTNLMRHWDKQDILKNTNIYRNKLLTGIKMMEAGYENKIKQCDELIKAKSRIK